MRSKRTRNHTRFVTAFLVGLIFAMCLAGCGSAIDPAPFHRFTESVTDLRDSSDDILALQYESARERFLDQTVLGDSLSSENVQRLLLGPAEERPFFWEAPEPQPLFLAARQFRETVGALNDVLVQYAELLAELAAAGQISEEEFGVTAEGINTGLRDAVGAFGETGHTNEIAIFSVAATQLFQQYLNSQSKDKLRRAIEGNQENIRLVSDHLHDAMRLASQHAFAEYSPRSLDLALSLGPDSPLSTGDKKDRLVQLIELDEALIKRLEALRHLNDAYQSLPGANRDLAASLSKGESALSSVKRIRDNAKRLRALYRTLSAAADTTAMEPEAIP